MTPSQYLSTPVPLLDRWAKWLLVALVFLIPLTTAGTSISRVLMVLVWLAAGGFAMRWQAVRRNPLTWLSLALFALVLLGGLYSSADAETVRATYSKYSKLLIFPIAISLLQERVWRERAVNAFIAAMVITLAASLLHAVWQFPGAKATADHITDNHYVFTNHIQQNVMMSFFVLICLTRALASTQPRNRWLWAATALVATIDIVFLVGSRTGHFTLVGNLLVFVLVVVPRKWRLAGFAALVCGLVALVLVSSNLQQRMEKAMKEVQTFQTNGTETSAGLRLGFWIGSAQLIERHPVLGTGTGSYEKEFCTVSMGPQWCGLTANGHPHNQVLHSWVENGVLGAILVAGLIGAPLAMLRRQPVRQKALIAGFAATFFIHSMLNASLFHIEGFFFLVLLAVLMARPDDPWEAGSAELPQTVSATAP